MLLIIPKFADYLRSVGLSSWLIGGSTLIELLLDSSATNPMFSFNNPWLFSFINYLDRSLSAIDS